MPTASSADGLTSFKSFRKTANLHSLLKAECTVRGGTHMIVDERIGGKLGAPCNRSPLLGRAHQRRPTPWRRASGTTYQPSRYATRSVTQSSAYDRNRQLSETHRVTEGFRANSVAKAHGADRQRIGHLSAVLASEPSGHRSQRIPQPGGCIRRRHRSYLIHCRLFLRRCLLQPERGREQATATAAAPKSALPRRN